MKKLLALILTLGLLTSCLSGLAAADSAPVTLRFSWWGGDARHEATLKAIALYEELNPGVKIEAEYSGYDGYNDKLLTQLAGGTQPDLFAVIATAPAEYYGSFPDSFVKLDEQSTFDLSGFSQDFLKSFCSGTDGHIVAVPTGVASYNFIMNRTVTKAAGIEIPETMTWEEFIEVGKALHAANPDYYMLTLNDDDMNHLLRSYVRQLTGKWTVSEDNTVIDDRDALIKAFTWLQTLYSEGVAEPMDTAFIYNGDKDANKKLLGNEIALSYRGSSSIVNMDTSAGMELDVINIPMDPNAKATGVITQPAQCMMISAGPNSEEALKFANWFYNDKDAALILKDCRGVPPVAEISSYLAEQGLLDPVVAKAVNIASAITDGPVYYVNENSEVYGFLFPLMQQLAYLAITPEEAADMLLSELPLIVENIQ